MRSDWRVLGLIVVAAVAVLWAVPFLWMAVASLRPGVPADIASLTPAGPFDAKLDVVDRLLPCQGIKVRLTDDALIERFQRRCDEPLFERWLTRENNASERLVLFSHLGRSR